MRILLALAALAISSTHAFAEAPIELSPIVTIDHDPVNRGISTVTSGASDRPLAGTPAQVLAMYRSTIEPTLGAPAGDLAGAVAFLLVQSYNAVNGSNNAVSRKLIDQIRGRLQANPAVTSASASQRRGAYEQTAIAGTMLWLLDEHLKEHPGASDARSTMKTAAGIYLGQLATDRIHLDGDGVSVDRPGDAERRKNVDEWSADRRLALDQVVAIAGGAGTTGSWYVPLFQEPVAWGDILILSDPAGIAAHMKKYPKDQRRWRRAGRGLVEINFAGQWSKGQLFHKQPRGTRIDKTISRSGAGGGAGVTMTSWSSTVYTADGRFARKSGGGSTVSTGRDTSVGATVRSSDTGTYEIDGYTITLRYDDGKVETRIIEISDDRSIIHIEQPYR